jgi:hypothetical protein
MQFYAFVVLSIIMMQVIAITITLFVKNTIHAQYGQIIPRVLLLSQGVPAKACKKTKHECEP